MRILKTAILVALLIAAFSAQAVSDDDDAISLLYVHHAHSMEYSDGTLTMSKADPLMLFFSDRPNRVYGHIKTSDFVSLWGEGDDSFQADPPNATLSVSNGDAEPMDAVVVLMNPRLSGTTIKYDLKVIEGKLPARGGPSVLFIDHHSFLGDTARGAVGGAVIGGIAGNAKKGAAIGAGVGAIHHAIKH